MNRRGWLLPCWLTILSALPAAAMAGGTAPDCKAFTPPSDDGVRFRFWLNELPQECLQYGGFFDVGAGYTVIRSANQAGQNAGGYMVSLRAYPFGRWYAPRKQVSVQEAVNKGVAATAPGADAKTKSDYVDSLAALSKQGDLFAIKEKEVGSHLLSRLSFYYGRSVGGFDAKVIDGDINSFGIGFDIAPEFMVTFGRAYYKEKLAGDASETRSRPIFGIQLNLNAFKVFRDLGS